MLKLFVGESKSGEFDSLVGAANSREDIDVVGVGSTGREVAQAVKSIDFNALIVPQSWAEMGRALRITLGSAPGSKPSFIIGTDELTAALVVKVALYGFDAAVPVTSDPTSALHEIAQVATSTRPLSAEPLLHQLGLQPGVLARELILVDPSDSEVADLVGSGLPDSDIARVTGKSIQQIRNVIEGLLHANGLTYRTQLAVLRSASWRIPDFS